MEAFPGFWHEVSPSAFIRGGDDTIWLVVAERVTDGRPQVLLEQRDGTRKTVWRPEGTTPVTFMRRTHEECEQMLATRLGATVEARRDPGFKIYDCVPINPRDGGTLRSHLHLFHGLYVGDVKGPKGLLEAHNDQHADFDAGHDIHAFVPHRHTSVRPLGVAR